jgi:hypothetical protein
MNHHDPLDTLLRDAAREWRAPTEVPRDAIWAAVTAELDAPARPVRRGLTPGWGLLSAAVAAALLIGVAIGRQGFTPAAGTVAATGTAAAAPDPYQRATEELLGQTAVLLVALPEQGAPAAANAQLVTQGVELLRSTRLLLDSPVATDPRMRALLEDLELVLAQVAGLEPRRADELTLIRDAVHQRDLLPRLRSAVVAHSLQLN